MTFLLLSFLRPLFFRFLYSLCSWIVPFLVSLFTAIVRHGFIPKRLRDRILVPIPIAQKDPSISDNYHPIALAPTLSKTF